MRSICSHICTNTEQEKMFLMWPVRWSISNGWKPQDSQGNSSSRCASGNVLAKCHLYFCQSMLLVFFQIIQWRLCAKAETYPHSSIQLWWTWLECINGGRGWGTVAEPIPWILTSPRITSSIKVGNAYLAWIRRLYFVTFWKSFQGWIHVTDFNWFFSLSESGNQATRL